MLWEVFKPGGPGFPLILIILVSLASGILCFLFQAIGKYHLASQFKLLSMLVCFAIVVLTVIKIILNTLALIGIVCW